MIFALRDSVRVGGLARPLGVVGWSNNIRPISSQQVKNKRFRIDNEKEEESRNVPPMSKEMTE